MRTSGEIRKWTERGMMQRWLVERRLPSAGCLDTVLYKAIESTTNESLSEVHLFKSSPQMLAIFIAILIRTE